MERLMNFIGVTVELIVMAMLFVFALPFRILYNLSNRLVSR